MKMIVALPLVKKQRLAAVGVRGRTACVWQKELEVMINDGLSWIWRMDKEWPNGGA
ncbi:hypothetical protein [Geobacillus jurassicus]|uniref:Transposase n=1 Tax=Geobacillus jurassicus TaxID=235932 RepID=A0ABV6GU94_9BACL|nr:hypothetical protein [Geobacillus jurassicus]